MAKCVLSSLLLLLPFIVSSTCPFSQQGTPPTNKSSVPCTKEYNEAVAKLSITDVFNDIYTLLNDSQECWPSDTYSSGSSYGPLFVRLSWHCSGTYRETDGAGGCSGGRQRFWPESSWEDNTNLDKARALLGPIKKKYGDGLSWGDLFIFAGTASILHMGGPISSVCAGRVDSPDGNLSEPLGPGPEQPPCPVQGDCPEPLGTSTVGLIYVNPQGVMGEPNPELSAPRIRDIFGRMGMNDSQTVALIGGGHTFGKSHGACPNGAGLPPNESPLNPWPGKCGSGKGNDTYSSGIEGVWTTQPLQWDNEYYKQLVNMYDSYELIKGPGGAWQWKNAVNGNMMMTTDMALMKDEAYVKIMKEYADDVELLDKAFAQAWKQLTESGGTWADTKKCVNVEVLRNERERKLKDGLKESLLHQAKYSLVGNV